MRTFYSVLAGVALLCAFGCSEDCQVGESCSPSSECDPGQEALCVAEGICSCKTINLGDGGPGGLEGGANPACPQAQPGEVIVNEIMIDGLAPEGDTEYVELVNTTDRAVGLGGLVLTSNKGQDQADRVVFDSACLPPHGAVAMFKNVESWIWVPEPAAPAVVQTRAFSFANSNPFDFRLQTAAGVIVDQAQGPADLIDEDVSVNRNPDGQQAAAMASHSAVSPSGLTKSPGRCANGGTFAKACADGQGGGDGGPVGDGGAADCQAPPPGPGELVINEVLVDGVVPRTEDDEFVELVNTTAGPLNLAGVRLVSGGDLVTFQAGCIPAGGAVATYGDPARFVWEPAAAVRFESTRFSFANGRGFDLQLIDASGEVLDVAQGAPELVAEGISANRSPELSGAFVRHDGLSPIGAGSSPARCANGGTFANQCEDSGPLPDGGAPPPDGGAPPPTAASCLTAAPRPPASPPSRAIWCSTRC